MVSEDGQRFLQLVDGFINDLEKIPENSDELLVTDTNDIGGQKLVLDEEKIEEKSIEETNNLIRKLDENNKILNMPIKERELFESRFTKFKKNELEIKAGKKIIEKKYDDYEIDADIDDSTKVKDDKNIENKDKASKKKTYARNMNIVAVAGLVTIAFLMVQSIACIDIGVVCTKNNPYTQILESNVMMVLVSTIVAPVAARILKERFDIDVEAKQIGMIMSDGIKSVTAYTKEADKLRDKSGHIPRKYQKVLRNKAFQIMKDNYGQDKYKEIVGNVGAQVFHKAIEDAVAKGKIEKNPFKKSQLEAIMKQSIDALPQIVTWKDLDEEVKHTFIAGNVTKLLQNVGAEGLAYDQLENAFDEEISKRLISAAIAEKKELLDKLDNNDSLRYVSTVGDAVFSTLTKK